MAMSNDRDECLVLGHVDGAASTIPVGRPATGVGSGRRATPGETGARPPDSSTTATSVNVPPM